MVGMHLTSWQIGEDGITTHNQAVMHIDRCDATMAGRCGAAGAAPIAALGAACSAGSGSDTGFWLREQSFLFARKRSQRVQKLLRLAQQFGRQQSDINFIPTV